MKVGDWRLFVTFICPINQIEIRGVNTIKMISDDKFYGKFEVKCPSCNDNHEITLISKKVTSSISA